jgi:hypothetical protein
MRVCPFGTVLFSGPLSKRTDLFLFCGGKKIHEVIYETKYLYAIGFAEL